MRVRNNAVTLAAKATVALVMASGLTHGASIDWVGTGADNFWATDANWDGGLAPTAADIASFPSLALAPAQVPLINSNVVVDGITINNVGGYVWQVGFDALSATSLTIGGSGITASGGGATTFHAATTTLSAAQTWDIGAGTSVNLRAIGGSGKLTKQGAGTAVISGNASGTHSGTIDVIAGTLANQRGSSGTGGTGNLVTVFTGAAYEAQTTNASVSLLLKDGATVRGNGSSVGLASSSGQHLRLDSTTDTTVTLSTVNATDVFAVSEDVSGGTANSVVIIDGPGRVSLRGNSTYTGSGPVTSFLGSWKVMPGATLSLENYEVGNSGVLGFNGTTARPVELAGGTLRAGITTNSGANIGAGTAVGNRSAITVTADSMIVVEKYTASATTTAGNITRSAGALTIGDSVLTVASGRLGETGTPVAPFVPKLSTQAVTLSGTPTFNVVNGPDLLGQPVNMEMEVGAVGGGSNGIIKTGNGLLYLTSANTYTGATTVNGGTLRFVTNGAQTTSSISVAAGAQVRMGNSSATSTKANLSGSGLIFMVDSAANALSLQGSAISPGNSAGVLTINGAPVILALDGAEKSSLNIEVLGGGAVAGTDYDQLVIGSTLTGLANADLFVNLSGVTGGDLAGDVLTIVTSTSDFTGLSFASVTFSPNWSGDVNYNNGSITLSNLALIPEPATLGLVGSAAMLLMGRRRRNENA